MEEKADEFRDSGGEVHQRRRRALDHRQNRWVASAGP
jgi:hypothetical protein